jgi:hypothetical protein
MKRLLYAILGFILIFYLFCITMAVKYPHGLALYSSPQKNNLKLDVESLSNVEIIVGGAANQQSCPPELINAISNTNLFTPEERKLIESIPVVYGHVASNFAPIGSVSIHLDWFHSSLNAWRHLGGNAHFQFTNSDLHDDAALGQTQIHHVRNKAGDGYDLYYRIEEKHGGMVPNFWLIQYKHGVPDGLRINILDDHCEQWMRFSNGLAVDQWLWWDSSGKLLVRVKFKAPYDYLKHSRTGLGS